MSEFNLAGMGWHPDLPDSRDYTIDHPKIAPLLDRFGIRPPNAKLPKTVDLRDENLLSPPEDQGRLASCCAFAVLDLIEYLERKMLGKAINSSKLFLYQLALRLEDNSSPLQSVVNYSTSLRNTLKTAVRFGSPPQRYWPYESDNFNQLPAEPFLYGYSREYDSILFFRPCAAENSRKDLLKTIKRVLVAGIPCVCGFSVPRSITINSHIPFPDPMHEILGGQAVLVLGYDDANVKSTNSLAKKKRKKKQGSLLIRGNWGQQWGEGGYGWLPYRFVKEAFAINFWSVIKPEWADALNE